MALLKEFALACFLTTNYPNNKTHYARFERAMKELAKRLGITDEELEEMRKRL